MGQRFAGLGAECLEHLDRVPFADIDLVHGHAELADAPADLSLTIGSTRAAPRPCAESGNSVRRMKAGTALVAAVRSSGRMPGKCEVRRSNDEWNGVEGRRGPSGPGNEHNVFIIRKFGAGAGQENQG
jgi:hypothetical protein